MKCHGTAPSAVGIIFPEKGHLFPVKVQDAVIGDRDPMGVAAEIANHLPRAAESRPDVHDPVMFVQRAQELSELLGIRQMADGAM